MEEATIHFLNDLNRRFYEVVAADFDESRQRAWQGWERLIEVVRAGDKPAPFSVLDVGCGNGRFGVFLSEQLGEAGWRYTGIDSSAILLESARQALAGDEARFIQRDLIEQPHDEALGQFDLVALFGVLHHIPGAERRRMLLRALAERVAPGGLLVFTEWRFLEDARLRDRIVPWSAVSGGEELQVEPGDYLLDWRRGVSALRYCHYVDETEHARLVSATGLALVTEYRADAANLYGVLQKTKTGVCP